MKTMTLRGIDQLLSEQLVKTAQRQGKSINQFILDTIKEQLGLDNGRRRTQEHHDLDHLFGRWTEEDCQQIQTKIDTERRIDPELWP
jgi:hypothetical protein